ncbi:MAG: threonine/serine exporter family protein [Clostridiales bacterium]|jgi:uncharacterized membrane protein YjjP (DUF1212 family)|nr:threonine/serine exporter family protein [Clostridiales bacterium]
MEHNQALSIALLAGEIMLANGAETHRIEDTLKRILLSLGFARAETFVTATGIFVSLGNESGSSGIKRVNARSYHMQKIARVNEVSRQLTAGKITPALAMEALETIALMPPYKLWIRMLCSGIACFCFCLMFGGGLSDCGAAFINGVIVCAVTNYLNGRYVSSFLTNLFGGAVISGITVALLNAGLGHSMENIIFGAIMPLVPGITMTNGIRDILEGDFLSGGSRMAEALIIAVAIAVGIGTVLQLWAAFFGSVTI